MELQGESGITGWDDQNFREVHSQTMSTEKGHFSQDDLLTINVGKVMINLSGIQFPGILCQGYHTIITQPLLTVLTHIIIHNQFF